MCILTATDTAIGRSPAHVTTAVKRATGRTVVESIIGGRMAEARRLLLQASEKVDEIAERVGCADPTKRWTEDLAWVAGALQRDMASPCRGLIVVAVRCTPSAHVLKSMR